MKGNELRKDPLLSRWVAVAGESLGPEAYGSPGESNYTTPCPLCGPEGGADILSIRESVDGREEWRVRVVPDPTHVLSTEGDLNRKGAGMYDKMNSFGSSEIVVESPAHGTSPEDMGAEQMRKVLSAYQSRIRDLQKDGRLRYVLVSKSRGDEAGARFGHSYSEVVATPVIPKRIKERLDGAKQYYAYKERCIFCDLIDEERRMAERVVMETGGFIVFCPYAPKKPFEFWLVPKRHACAFEESSEADIVELGEVISTVLRKMKAVLKTPPFNYVIYTAPNRMPRRDHWHTLGDDFHWHMEFLPRLTRNSGVELGSGFYTLTTSPEDAAKYLREA